MSGAVIPFCVPDGTTILSAVALSWTMLRFGSGRLGMRVGQKDARGKGESTSSRGPSLPKRDGLVAGENQ